MSYLDAIFGGIIGAFCGSMITIAICGMLHIQF